MVEAEHLRCSGDILSREPHSRIWFRTSGLERKTWGVRFKS